MNDNLLYLNKIWENKKKFITPTIEILYKSGNWNKKNCNFSKTTITN